ncbi:MAG TPA: DUF4282 domain-containing protein [Streptosporangiaceae bacterium]
MSQQPPGQGWGGAPGQSWGGGSGPGSAGVPGQGPAAAPGPPWGGEAARGQYRPAGQPSYGADPGGQPTYGTSPGGQPAGQPGGPGGQPSAGRPSFATQQLPVAEPKGFLGALFDFSFTSFVTPKVVKVLYVLIVVVVGLSALGFALSVLATSVGLGLIVLLIGAPLYFLVVTALYRITLEFFMVVFRMAQDIRAIRERGDFR